MAAERCQVRDPCRRPSWLWPLGSKSWPQPFFQPPACKVNEILLALVWLRLLLSQNHLWRQGPRAWRMAFLILAAWSNVMSTTVFCPSVEGEQLVQANRDALRSCAFACHSDTLDILNRWPSFHGPGGHSPPHRSTSKALASES